MTICEFRCCILGKKTVAGSLLKHLIFYSTKLVLKNLFFFEKSNISREDFWSLKYDDRWYFKSSVNYICDRTPNLDSLHSYNPWQSLWTAVQLKGSPFLHGTIYISLWRKFLMAQVIVPLFPRWLRVITL